MFLTLKRATQSEKRVQRRGEMVACRWQKRQAMAFEHCALMNDSQMEKEIVDFGIKRKDLSSTLNIATDESRVKWLRPTYDR